MPLHTENITIGKALRYWRKKRKLSQLELALNANISARHLSFIETGKAKPGRDVILSLARRLELPYKQQNLLLLSAGYQTEYPQSEIASSGMEIVRHTLERILAKHEPYPALVVTPNYDILMATHGFNAIVTKFISAEKLENFSNIYRLFFSTDGLQPFVTNWEVISSFLLRRLQDEALLTQNTDIFLLLDELKTIVKDSDKTPVKPQDDIPVLSFELKKKDLCMKFFSTITTFGAPMDISVQELRIESLFPADETTKIALENQG